MAANGVNATNVGRDVSLVVVADTGTLAMDITQSFTSKMNYDHRVSRPLNGTPQYVDIPAGWDGSCYLDRQDPVVDNFFAAREAAYYAGSGIGVSTISETIVNAIDGSVSVYQYRGVSLTFDDAGAKKADDVIKMRVGFRASTRTKLS